MRTVNMQEQIKLKAAQLGIWEEALTCALDIIAQNKELVNAMEIISEMDEYIYRAIIKESIEKRKVKAQLNLRSADFAIKEAAINDLTSMSRDELVTDPYYRAVLPMIIKIVGQDQPILKLHAEEASAIVFKLAAFKSKHRSTSVTKIIVTNCSQELKSFYEAHSENTRLAS